ncbi:hypothetical protein [Flavobacterium sp.]|uniref:hypothetical protein n=1 Tax=Flavobacterium sp. TaxID=239 RepID=UPI003D6AB9DC
MKKIKKTKFNLEKFEIAKLRNLKTIRGGDGQDPDKPTIEITILLGGSTNRCAD